MHVAFGRVRRKIALLRTVLLLRTDTPFEGTSVGSDEIHRIAAEVPLQKLSKP